MRLHVPTCPKHAPACAHMRPARAPCTRALHARAQDFANKTQHVVFYDMGSGSTSATLVKYSSYTVKGKAISQLEVRAVWEAN